MPQLFGFAPVSIRGPEPLPIIGKAKILYELLDDPVAVLLRLRERGEVVALIDRSPAVVCVFGPEKNREILTNPAVFQHDETLFRGPRGSAMEKMRWSSVTINGELHKRHRKLMQPAFQKSALDAYASEIVASTRMMLARWKVGSVEPVDSLCRDAALTMAMKCLYGVDVSGEAHDLGNMAAEWVDAATTPMAFLLPLDLPGTPYRKMVKLGEAVINRILALMDDKRRMGGEQKDALALLMNARDDDQTALSDDELVAEAASLFVAAHETTAMTLAWTLLLLDRHPNVHTSLVAEIDTVLAGRDPGPEDLPRMDLLDRVIRESMRILSSVPMLFMRVCSEATTVGGFAVPKGSNVLMSPIATHHDPVLYPEPKRFLPDRWIGKSPVPYGYLPFGAGPRTCVGMLFAERAMRLMLPMILQRFRLSIPSGTRVDRLTRGNVLKMKHGLPMLIEPASAPAGRRARITGDVHDLLEY